MRHSTEQATGQATPSAPAGRQAVAGGGRHAVEVQGAVDRVLLSHGEYAPVELLMDQGRLDYSDYEAWRCGDLACLEDALAGNRARIRDMLREAARWARRLGLAPARVDYGGWGALGGAALTFSPESDLAVALTTHYRREDASPQLDLFLDGGEAALIMELRTALAARQSDRAASLLGDFLGRFPDHRLRPDAERLCDALAHLEADGIASSAEQEFHRLRHHLVPAAERLLSARCRDFMTPFWRRLAVRLEELPFDPANPERHASWVYAQCLDWRGVRRSVLAGGEFPRQPVLLTRLAEAERRLGERVAAIERLALLCWCFSEQAESLLDADGFPDAGVGAAWQSYQDLDLEPPVESAWFPAWLLLCEPGLAKAWRAPLPDEAGPAGRGFDALKSLVAVKAADRQEIALRRELQQSHSGFFALFLQWQTGRRD